MGFDWIAKYYDPLAMLVFGKSLRMAQTCFLDRVPPASKVLVLGGGTGWWLNEFLEHKPTSKIVYIDESSEMIRLAKKSTNNDSRIVFVQGTQDSIPRQTEFDVVILFCFLDIFSDEQLPELLGRVRGTMNSNGLWLVADFIKKGWWHSLLLVIMYRFFKRVTGLRNQKLPDWQKALQQVPLRIIDERSFFGQFIKSCSYQQ